MNSLQIALNSAPIYDILIVIVTHSNIISAQILVHARWVWNWTGFFLSIHSLLFAFQRMIFFHIFQNKEIKKWNKMKWNHHLRHSDLLGVSHQHALREWKKIANLPNQILILPFQQRKMKTTMEKMRERTVFVNRAKWKIIRHKMKRKHRIQNQFCEQTCQVAGIKERFDNKNYIVTLSLSLSRKTKIFGYLKQMIQGKWLKCIAIEWRRRGRVMMMKKKKKKHKTTTAAHTQYNRVAPNRTEQNRIESISRIRRLFTVENRYFWMSPRYCRSPSLWPRTKPRTIPYEMAPIKYTIYKHTHLCAQQRDSDSERVSPSYRECRGTK